MRAYGNKVCFAVSLDSDVKRLFIQKYPGQASYMIEGFMRDMLRLDIADINPNDSTSDIDKLIEDTSAEKHRVALKLQALEIQKKEHEEKERQATKRRNEEAELIMEKARFEGEALQQLVRKMDGGL